MWNVCSWSFWEIRAPLAKVRFGSLADIGEHIRDVRFTLNSGPAASLLKESGLCQKQTWKGPHQDDILMKVAQGRKSALAKGGVHE
jgi:hypothetical protein